MPTNIEAGRGIDTAVVVPASILAGASRADQLIAEEQAKARGEAPPTPPLAQPDGKDAQPPAAPPQNLQPPQVQPEVIPPSPQQQVSPEQWEERFRRMKGRFDALVASSQQSQQEYERQLEELRRAQTAQPPPPAPAAFDEEDDATWGPDFRNAVQRRIDAAAQQIRAELSGRVQQVEATAGQSREQTLRAELDRALPTWDDINYDPQFHAWLELPDAMSGVKRSDLVKRAWAAGDAQRVLLFFNSFLSEADPAPAGSQPAAQPPLVPNGPPASQRLSLTDLAAPGPARPAAAGNPPAPAEKRFWTQAEIGQFFAAKNRGLYDHTPENRAMRDAYEADIFLAQTENRVR